MSAVEAGRSTDFDILVIGAGAAGVCAAHVLCARGLRVGLVDNRAKCPPTFKAEKLEPDQFAILKEIDLLQQAMPAISPLREVVVYRRDSIIQRLKIDQFGMHYHDFVNTLRDKLPSAVTQIIDTASELDTAGSNPAVKLQSGGTVTARLVVVAAGTSGRLRQVTGAVRRDVSTHHSIAFGFDLALDAGGLPHDGVNVLPDRYSDRVGFLTLFPTPVGVRANLFSYHDPQSEWSREMRLNTGAALERTFSRLRRVVGNFTIVGRVNAAAIDLWTSDVTPQPGVVLIGDAFQSVCPVTGTGLSKVLTDVHVLGQMAPEWLATPGMSAGKTAAYYASAAKRSSDERSLQSALYSKRASIDQGLRARLARFRRDTIGRLRYVTAAS
ncbi:MAG TPA: FAD-dependent monooxygenase [Steroidobacteraceae bacterium]|nr:FAD-dependent monooxygenase [Steroidobacteraceae bacterium]